MDKTTLLRTAILNGIEAANLAVMSLGNGSATTLTVITIEGGWYVPTRWAIPRRS